MKKPLLFVIICFFSLLFAHRVYPKDMRLIRIGTGGTKGVYYPIGKLIAKGLTLKAADHSSVLHGYVGVPQISAGSIENANRVIDGEIEVGLVQADIADFAFKGMRTFKGNGNGDTLRALCSLYPEKFQIVVRKDANILSVNDLKGTKISIDEQGSGSLSAMQIILDAHGMTEKDFYPKYLKPIFAHENLRDGGLQGFVIMAGVPLKAVTELYETGVTLVPIRASVMSKINKQFPYLYPGKIAANTYADIPETLTLEVYSLLVVSEKMPDDTAFAIVESLFGEEMLELLKNGHPQGESITLGTALSGVSIPLHSGAKRFYQKTNMVK